MLILGGQSTVNLGRICKDFGRITSDSVDPGWGQLTVNLGRICKDFGRITSDSVDPGGQGSINSQLGKTSVKTLEGLPLTVLIPGGQGGSIDSQLRKDPGRLWKVTSDSVNPGGGGGQSTVNLARISQILWKDYL